MLNVLVRSVNQVWTAFRVDTCDLTLSVAEKRPVTFEWGAIVLIERRVTASEHCPTVAAVICAIDCIIASLLTGYQLFVPWDLCFAFFSGLLDFRVLMKLRQFETD